jgi:hypothetical protein
LPFFLAPIPILFHLLTHPRFLLRFTSLQLQKHRSNQPIAAQQMIEGVLDGKW